AALVAVAGWSLERARFGATDAASLERIETELRQRFGASAETLGMMSARVSAARDLIGAAPRDTTAARRLFDLLDSVLPADDAMSTGITVYDSTGVIPLAWSGRVTEADRLRDRIAGPDALFVAPGALGPRLVRVEPVVEPG